jgi:catechol 2,3-dioxygenase-like lactoylglutathione lyase family enzyme
MRIYVTSVFVDDQQKALKFYTEALGFRKKAGDPSRRGRLAHGGFPRGS